MSKSFRLCYQLPSNRPHTSSQWVRYRSPSRCSNFDKGGKFMINLNTYPWIAYHWLAMSFFSLVLTRFDWFCLVFFYCSFSCLVSINLASCRVSSCSAYFLFRYITILSLLLWHLRCLALSCLLLRRVPRVGSRVVLSWLLETRGCFICYGLIFVKRHARWEHLTRLSDFAAWW